jgi:isocitrate/isopropylmalate dehydrogenase
MTKIACIAGDGIGKEVTAEALKVVRRVGECPGARSRSAAGRRLLPETGITMPPNGYDAAR